MQPAPTSPGPADVSMSTAAAFVPPTDVLGMSDAFVPLGSFAAAAATGPLGPALTDPFGGDASMSPLFG